MYLLITTKHLSKIQTTQFATGASLIVSARRIHKEFKVIVCLGQRQLMGSISYLSALAASQYDRRI